MHFAIFQRFLKTSRERHLKDKSTHVSQFQRTKVFRHKSETTRPPRSLVMAGCSTKCWCPCLGGCASVWCAFVWAWCGHVCACGRVDVRVHAFLRVWCVGCAVCERVSVDVVGALWINEDYRTFNLTSFFFSVDSENSCRSSLRFFSS